MNYFFTPGKLSTCLDISAGSSGKGKTGAFVCSKADNWTFCCNAFNPQAGHWVRFPDKSYFYQTLNSCAWMDRLEKMYIGPGAMLELPALWRELEENNLSPKKVRISPLASILQQIDTDYERGLVDFEGNPTTKHDGTMKYGSTAHGCGAAKARKVLRKGLIARDVPELKEFLAPVPEEIMERLDRGESGLLEIAQGFQLSLNSNWFPFTTSRNCTVTAGLDDMMLPVHYAGNVLLNCRTFPIRINNSKYVDEQGKHLFWNQVVERRQNGREVLEIKYNSGSGYPDQEEITWEELTTNSDSDKFIIEMTSVTKLPRRVFTFSKQNLTEAAKYNRANGELFVSLNFVNYIDASVYGKTSGVLNNPKIREWINKNMIGLDLNATLVLVGTGEMHDMMEEVNVRL